MPTYEHDKDQPESIDARASQDDPSVMYLVARKEHGASLEGLLVAAAKATCDVVARYVADPRYELEFAHWGARSFRKVCLRANERDWPRVTALDGGDGAASGEVVVRALPPRRKSAREKLLVHLQAYTPCLHELPTRAVAIPEVAPVMPFVMNAGLSMSVGKLAAQVGHAALLTLHAFGVTDAEAIAAWELAGRPCAVFRASGEEWERLKRDEHCAVVRDAGLTEVAHGSETVLALAPSRWDRLSARLRELPRA